MGRLSIRAQIASLKLHADLPPTKLWCYRLDHGKRTHSGSGNTYLGPTVVVNRGDLVATTWGNKIIPSAGETAKLPFEVVKIDTTAAGGVPQNLPGSASALDDTQDTMRARWRDLRAVLVTHLHGGRTQADSDGWPDNSAVPGQAAHYTYHNDQSATMLWYHDHTNHVTRLNVFAGLAGAWLIRDKEEAALKLPKGNHELPLVIQDRNLAVDGGTDTFTGALLHKTEVNGGPGEFFGPYTLVNGKIWPKADIEPTLYRFRVLNGCNARTYRLALLDEAGATRHDKAWLIGTDQGLRREKLPLPPGGLLLAPGERADILIDFTEFQRHSLYLWNTAEAPFGADPGYTPDAQAELQALLADPLANIPDEPGRRAFPQIMRFDVGTKVTGTSAVLPDRLRTSSPWSAKLSDTSPIRLTALVERPAPSPTDTSMLVFWEYVEVTPTTPAPPGAAVIDFNFVHPFTGAPVAKQFWKAAEEFYDQLNWRVHLNSTEQWYVVNLSPDTHPIHVHLVDMKINQRSEYDVFIQGNPNPVQPAVGGRTPVIDGTPNTGNTVVRIDVRNPLDVEADQTDAKDTMRVNPGEMVGFAMKFAPFCGHYMIHCHILEHEDHDMMRPYVVVDPSVPPPGLSWHIIHKADRRA
jgi:o-aminophenol oxidase